MAWGVTITKMPAGDFEVLELLSIGYYILANGAATRLYEQVAWCQDCRLFVRAEFLTTVAALDAQITECRGKAAKTRKALAGWLYRLGLKSGEQLSHELGVWEDSVAELELAREWRLARESPPRCLECGSTNLTLFPDEQAYPHPAGEGFVRVETTSHISLGPGENEYYTAEGLRITGVRISV